MNRAEIVTIGDELLSGETVDTNANWLDGTLAKLGWTVVRHTTVADDLDDIAGLLSAAAERSDLVISSGGLGPTRDDLTLEALAKALGCSLEKDEAILQDIKNKFEAIGRKMSPNNERQAMVPEIGEAIMNPVGTAPAFFAELNGAMVFLVPGVPREVKFLLKNVLAERLDRGGPVILRRTMKVVGFGESRLEHSIREIVKAHRRDVQFGFRAIGVENHIKLAATGEDREAKIDAAQAALTEVLGVNLFGVDDDHHPEVIGNMLADRGDTVALAESCTGGLALKLLTDVAGSSRYVLGGCVTYSNASKVELVGVKSETLDAHGAVSAEVAEQMAAGVRDRLGATWGLSATGIAGPGGGSEDKPVGLVFIGLAGPDGVEHRRLNLFGDRDQIRKNAATSLLDFLRRKLL